MIIKYKEIIMESKKEWHVCYDCGYGEMGSALISTPEVYEWFKSMGCTDCGEQFTNHLIENHLEDFKYGKFTVIHHSKVSQSEYLQQEINSLAY